MTVKFVGGLVAALLAITLSGCTGNSGDMSDPYYENQQVREPAKSNPRACREYVDGYKFKLQEDGTAYSFEVWRQKARDAAAVAEPELAFELMRFANRDNGRSAIRRIATLCGPGSGADFLIDWQIAEQYPSGG